MRLRTFVGLVATCTIAGGVLAASSASAYQLREPSSAAPALATQLIAPTSDTDVHDIDVHDPTSTTPTSVTPSRTLRRPHRAR